MPDFWINGHTAPNIAGGYTSWAMAQSYWYIPAVGRVAANGHRYVWWEAMSLYLGGRGGARSARLFAGNARTPPLTWGAASGTTSYHTGLQAFEGPWGMANPGGQTMFGMSEISGSMNTGRASHGGNAVFNQNGAVTFGDCSLVGIMRYSEVPSAPAMTGLTDLGGGLLRANFTGNGVSDGGRGIVDWCLQVANDANFTSIVANVINVSGQVDIQLTPGATAYVRACGRNAVSAWGGALGGEWSGPRSITLRVGGKRYNGSSFVNSGPKRYNGSAFVDSSPRRFNGSTWVPVGG